MRSSKSRQRSKSNRPRSIGNIVNRVFDSSGPEGKVRGTPQQIIDKYLILARDAQLSNDRVAAENFQQHAEHYTRMLGEALREMAAEQDQRRDGGGQNGGPNGNGYGQNGGYRDRPMRDEGADQPGGQRAAAVIDLADDGEGSGLVETPEARSRADVPRGDFTDRPPQGERQDRPDRQDRRGDRPRFVQGERREDRRPAPQDAAPSPAPVQVPVKSVEAAPLSPMMPSFEAPADEGAADAGGAKPAAPRRPRTPRKPKTPGSDPVEAAE